MPGYERDWRPSGLIMLCPLPKWKLNDTGSWKRISQGTLMSSLHVVHVGGEQMHPTDA